MTGQGITPAGNPPTPRYRPHRVISVHVETLAIEDGHTRLPVVGEHAEFVLGFLEAGPGTPTELVSTFRVWAEPAHTRPPPRGMDFSGRVRDDPPLWRTRLTAERWSAMWHANRPTVGQLELRGTISGDWSYGVREVTKGRVLRVRRVTQTRRRVGPGATYWREIPEATLYADLDPTAATVLFDRGLELGPPIRGGPYHALVPPRQVWTYDSGLLVDLDLDDVPSPRLRPSIVPGAVAAHGADVWVTDTRLPVLLHLRHGAVVSETTWRGVVLAPEQLRDGRGLHADATGCWVTGPDGVHRADLDGTVRTIREERTSATATTTAGLLAVRVLAAEKDGTGSSGAGTVLVDPAGVTRSIVGLPDRLSPDGEGFVGLAAGPERAFVRVHPDGSVEQGPVLRAADLGSWIAGDTPWLRSGAVVRRVSLGLTLGSDVATATPGRARRWWTWAGRMWAFGDPPPGTTWDPDIGPRTSLTEVDPRSGKTVVTSIMPVREITSLALDADGTVWATGTGELLQCCGERVGRVDVAALLDAHREQGDAEVSR